MRSVEDKNCYANGPSLEVPGNGAASSFEFHRGNGNNRSSHHRMALGKPTPSKWDDAQKWLIGLSRTGESKNNSQAKAKPRNSNADDLRLIAPVPQREQGCSSGGEEEEEDGEYGAHMQVKTKKVDCADESIWRINKPSNLQGPVPSSVVRSICVRDMGTEMTPIASQEPSRTGTPIRASTPVGRSPINSGSSTPVRSNENHQHQMPVEGRGQSVTTSSGGCENSNLDQARKLNPLETRAMAWDEAERAKYMARYKREEVKIQAWENHEKRKAEMQMKKMEVKAERMKARAQEKLANKLAATKRIAEEKRANAEAKLNEKAARTSERADYIRRTGHLPSSFSLKLPSFCW
ncbi:remorin 1.4 [Punica granatum]|uniref:Remorin 1.4 n=2 Tax=Punica granatum TaxID=22663 RepID=A0A6P8DAN2_PUNGR|nr:remorin 1.4 [Punica granatum]XP_031388282.1 remorin 1.4 [Punica granatum]XP_031388283.1 remorin 1.4 [Punica granatum]XP_031388284.1 remorin 1.4 [Punica granatum]XP_031388285.1 remorin 1.4 [Punica granatum]PKI78335.1 hypothetical protein CRG98_001278 [Punica granatum]